MDPRGVRIRRAFDLPLRAALVALLLVVEVASLPAVAGDATRSEWTSLASGLWYRTWTLTQGAQASPAVGHVFRADPRQVRVTVLDADGETPPVARVADLRRKAGAYLVVNGSFFDEHSRPLGLVVGDGKERSPLRKIDQGIFLIVNEKPRIQHARDPLPDGVEMAIQSFPRLVVDGRPLRLKPQTSRRTSVCLPGDGTVLLVVIPTAISLADLAANLVRPPSSGGLGCWAALNLDGGPSTQMSVETPAMALEIEGGWPVPNGLAILPR